ncbi:hypothetical protein AA14337_3083 [Acetobacter malorum DSM 14337]|uniref:HTH crp-type domain-containing protein n=1 Tax=Acetobacter malorum DSM 14337 TaxID=1307910 RepID=A0ABQ0PZK9_9PROT|nr:hypothetical protein [Acetobacter malorum]KXV05669.1 hypothetical protein AD930_11070 [Acetobacter malorum]GBQ85485.1 hypothetical protein AA14337_3083 [Acetobacter malorum DSM 14337]
MHKPSSLSAFRSRLSSAIEAKDWQGVNRVRLAMKGRVLGMVRNGCEEGELRAFQKTFTEASERIGLGYHLSLEDGPLLCALKIAVAAEDAGMASEAASLPPVTLRAAKGEVMGILSSGVRDCSTTSLARLTGLTLQTVARALGALRAEGKIVSNRLGRHVYHREVVISGATSLSALFKMDKSRPEDWGARQSLSDLLPPTCSRLGHFNLAAQ